MINTQILKEKFNIDFLGDKVIVNDNLIDVLDFLKNTAEFNFEVLTSMIAVDLKDKIEIIYQLYSVSNNLTLNISYFTEYNRPVPSVTGIFKSAYFDECEIFDLFGVKFEGNKNLKRILLPESWIGHPLLKSYKQEDVRLSWNE